MGNEYLNKLPKSEDALTNDKGRNSFEDQGHPRFGLIIELSRVAKAHDGRGLDYEQTLDGTKSTTENAMEIHGGGGDHDVINTRDDTIDQDGGKEYDVSDSTNDADAKDDATKRGDDANEQHEGIKGGDVKAQTSELKLQAMFKDYEYEVRILTALNNEV